MMRMLFLAAGAAALAGCARKAETAAQEPAASEAPAAATDAGAGFAAATKAIESISVVDETAPEAGGAERFYGRERFTIVSSQSGAETGEIIEHVRDWGRKRVEIKNTTLSVSGFTKETATRTIYDGASIVTVESGTGAATTTDNPLYNTMVARMKGKSGVDFGRELMTQMGGSATGEKGSFAGESCDYWELAQMGVKTCVAPWGGSLKTVANLGGISFDKTATEIRIGDGGPDDAFSYDPSKATAGPDLNQLIQQMRQKPN